ncbi:MAG: hypothetical protein JST39_07075, partial [Bacteroidetes bacterium]|nr:hypothetical protein [Bacteroidota bacterium]
IHDLRHSIKNHDAKATSERQNSNGQLGDSTWAEHEQLLDDYQRLSGMLQELKTSFRQFIARLN